MMTSSMNQAEIKEMTSKWKAALFRLIGCQPIQYRENMANNEKTTSENKMKNVQSKYKFPDDSVPEYQSHISNKFNYFL